MVYKELWIINTKDRQELEGESQVVLSRDSWQSVEHGQIKFSRSNEGVSLLVKRYCVGVYVSVNAPEGLVRGSIRGSAVGHLIPEWACKKITAVDPENDAEYFI